MHGTYTSNMFFNSTFTAYDEAKFSLDIDDLHGAEYDTAHAVIAESIEVELLDPDHNDRDPEYARVLGIYADEYDNEINMVDAIDTESDFDADEINSRYWVML